MVRVYHFSPPYKLPPRELTAFFGVPRLGDPPCPTPAREWSFFRVGIRCSLLALTRLGQPLDCEVRTTACASLRMASRPASSILFVWGTLGAVMEHCSRFVAVACSERVKTGTNGSRRAGCKLLRNQAKSKIFKTRQNSRLFS
jgi:hypothetical protein